jgi:ABC-2 type transport system ATP-binding protein
MAMSEAAISVRGLRKAYGGQEAVRGIDFEVAVGEVFGFLGPNGAGKTTTIEILEGYRERGGGEVSVLGVDPAQPTRAWRERVGLVLQECELDPLLTVREAVDLFATFYRTPRPVDETIELTGLGSKRDARIGSLSGGQKRRVDVAIGIVGDPDLIFLDEPTTGFDPTARREAWKMIEGLKELGKTVFLTTHYMDEAQHLADRVAILRAGEIVGQGSIGELSERLKQTTTIECVLDGRRISIESERPQEDLQRLFAEAEELGAEVAELEVRRPNLEDIFLDLTATEETAA